MLKLYRIKSYNYRQITEKKINSYNCTLNVQKARRTEHETWYIQKIFKSSFYRLKGVFLFFKKIILCIYFCLCWVFVAVQAFLSLQRVGATL